MADFSQPCSQVLILLVQSLGMRLDFQIRQERSKVKFRLTVHASGGQQGFWYSCLHTPSAVECDHRHPFQQRVLKITHNHIQLFCYNYKIQCRNKW